MPVLGRGQPNPPIIERSSFQDDPVLTTAAPIVEALPRHPAWLPPLTSPIILRSSLVDVVVVTAATPAPIVVAAPTPPSRFAPGPPIVDRGTLQDDPVLTTAPPVVVEGPAVTRPAVVILSRSSLEDAAVVVAATTPEPIVVVPVPPQAWRWLPIVIRTAPPDLTTSVPIVVVPVPGRRWPTQAIILRSTLADPPVLTTPQPIVIAAPRWRNPTYPIVSVAPFILPPPDIIDANGRVTVSQTVVSTVDAGSAPTSQAGVDQAFASGVAGSSSAAGGATSVDPTNDGRAEVG